MIELTPKELKAGDLIHVPGLIDKTAYRRVTAKENQGAFVKVITGKYVQYLPTAEPIPVYDRKQP